MQLYPEKAWAGVCSVHEGVLRITEFRSWQKLICHSKLRQTRLVTNFLVNKGESSKFIAPSTN